MIYIYDVYMYVKERTNLAGKKRGGSTLGYWSCKDLPCK